MPYLSCCALKSNKNPPKQDTLQSMWHNPPTFWTVEASRQVLRYRSLPKIMGNGNILSTLWVPALIPTKCGAQVGCWQFLPVFGHNTSVRHQPAGLLVLGEFMSKSLIQEKGGKMREKGGNPGKYNIGLSPHATDTPMASVAVLGWRAPIRATALGCKSRRVWGCVRM